MKLPFIFIYFYAERTVDVLQPSQPKIKCRIEMTFYSFKGLSFKTTPPFSFAINSQIINFVAINKAFLLIKQP